MGTARKAPVHVSILKVDAAGCWPAALLAQAPTPLRGGHL